MKPIKDILNWYFLKKVIKENQNTPEWKNLNLRVDWVNRIYTVMDVKEVQDAEEFKDFELAAMVIDKSKRYNNYLGSLNLAEIISPDIQKIEGTESWLLVYTFIWRWWNWKKIAFIFISILSLILWLIFK